MNDYITLDGYKYRTPARSWVMTNHKPASVKPTLIGETDATYGPVTILEWRGEIAGPVTAPGAGWGTIATLRATLKKRSTLSFTDHYGTTRTVNVLGPFIERSLTPNWDAPSNQIYASVTILYQEA